tara:strand:- start:287 stop:466 length:180 start_codon:yes stop_codon:yes gene_type:complete
MEDPTVLHPLFTRKYVGLSCEGYQQHAPIHVYTDAYFTGDPFGLLPDPLLSRQRETKGL